MENDYEKERVEQQTGSANTKKRREKRGWTPAKVVALASCCAVLGGVLGGGGSYLLMRHQGREFLQTYEDAQESSHSSVREGSRDKTALNVSYVDTSREMTAAEVYAANVNSTVGITTSVTTNYWGFQTTSPASGSGFLITDDGYVVTNYHVVENANDITVSLYDGTTCAAELIGYDESNDVAVLKIDAEGLTPVVLGDSDSLRVGDSVIAIGNPLGELTFSLTSGAVSALNREITLSNNVTMDLIQTDCAINSGNSGGALFNLHGEVVGVTNAKYSSSGSGASIDNIAFAIPINRVRKIAESIIENGYVTKPYIGVSVTDVSQELLNYGLPKGAVVKEVEDGGPASEAGLEENDIITAVNGEEIDGGTALVKKVGNASSGDELILSVFRQGKSIEVSVTVGERVQQALETKESEETERQPQGTERQITLPWGSRGWY